MEFAAPIIAALALVLLKFFLRSPTGKIESPVRNREVGAVFSAWGTLSGAHRWHHIWLAVQVGNRLWPKEPEIPIGESWMQKVVEAGEPPGATFSLALLAVRAKGNRRIHAWLQKGRRGQGHPGLRRIPGATKLHIVKGLRVAAEEGPRPGAQRGEDQRDAKAAEG